MANSQAKPLVTVRVAISQWSRALSDRGDDTPPRYTAYKDAPWHDRFPTQFKEQPLGPAFAYEVGNMYRLTDGTSSSTAGANGFLSFDDPILVLDCGLVGSRFMQVQAGGKTVAGLRGSVTSSELRVSAELPLPSFIRLVVESRDRYSPSETYHYSCMSRAMRESVATAEDDVSAMTTEFRANAATAGDRSYALTLHQYSCAVSAGRGAHCATTGREANAATACLGSDAFTSGSRSNAVTAGELAYAATIGDRSHAAATGADAFASTKGSMSHALAAGDKSHAHAKGHQAHAITTGRSSHASANGAGGIACALGDGGTASASDGNWIVLAAYDEGGNVVAVRSARIGDCGLKPDTPYRLNVMGEFEEFEDRVI
jgi:hypothetical protein